MQRKAGAFRRQGGFSLIEVSFVIAVTGLLLQGYFEWKQRMLDEAVIQKTVQGFALVSEALYAYRVARKAWPNQLSSLATYLPHFQNVNGIGKSYQIRIFGQGMIISTEMETSMQQQAVVASFPVNSQAVGLVGVEMGIPRPGFETAHSQLLHRGGGSSQAMFGSLHVGGYTLTDVGRITLRTGHQEGGHCFGAAIGASFGGEALFCKNRRWQKLQGATTQLRTGQAIAGSYVGPPAGFTNNQCILTTDAPASFQGRSGHESFSTYSRKSGLGWHLIASIATPSRRSGIDIRSGRFVHYQMICTQSSAT